MTADVQRELAEKFWHRLVAGSNAGVACACGWFGAGADFEAHALDAIATAIADAEKRAAAKALRLMAQWTVDAGYADAAVLREFRDRATALDPS